MSSQSPNTKIPTPTATSDYDSECNISDEKVLNPEDANDGYVKTGKIGDDEFSRIPLNQFYKEAKLEKEEIKDTEKYFRERPNTPKDEPDPEIDPVICLHFTRQFYEIFGAGSDQRIQLILDAFKKVDDVEVYSKNCICFKNFTAIDEAKRLVSNEIRWAFSAVGEANYYWLNPSPGYEHIPVSRVPIIETTTIGNASNSSCTLVKSASQFFTLLYPGKSGEEFCVNEPGLELRQEHEQFRQENEQFRQENEQFRQENEQLKLQLLRLQEMNCQMNG